CLRIQILILSGEFGRVITPSHAEIVQCGRIERVDLSAAQSGVLVTIAALSISRRISSGRAPRVRDPPCKYPKHAIGGRNVVVNPQVLGIHVLLDPSGGDNIVRSSRWQPGRVDGAIDGGG